MEENLADIFWDTW